MNQAQVFAFGRHIVSYAAGGITVAAGAVGILYSLHGVTAEQAASLSGAFTDLGHGLTTVAGAIATIASVAAAAWAAYTASTTQQVAAAASSPDVHLIHASPEIADAVANNKVTAP